MSISAYDFGKKHDSCILHERKEFDEQNPGQGQAGFYASCQNGNYLLWQLCRVPEEQLLPHMAALAEIAKRAAKRAGGYAATYYTAANYTTTNSGFNCYKWSSYLF